MYSRSVTLSRLSHCISSLPCRMLNSVPLSFYEVASQDVDSKRTPLLIFHGLFGSKTNWKSVSSQLANRTKRKIYAFDLRNHGDSPHADGSLSDLSAMASDIDLFMQNAHLNKACLLGHSLGGRVTSQFAFNSPDKVDKLILADISPLNKLPKLDFLDDSLFESLKESIQNLPPNIDLSAARAQVGDALLKKIQSNFIAKFFLLSLYQDQDNLIKWKFNVDALKFLVQNRVISKLEYKKPFTGPTLLIYGEKSEYVSPKDFAQIKDHMPSAQFVSIQEAGHYLHVEKPNEFIEHVVQFLQ